LLYRYRCLQYVKDIDEDLARAAIRAVGQVALKVPEVNGILDRLLLFLGYEKDYVTAETLIQVCWGRLGSVPWGGCRMGWGVSCFCSGLSRRAYRVA